MTNFRRHAVAIIAAMTITVLSFHTLATVPTADGSLVAVTAPLA